MAAIIPGKGGDKYIPYEARTGNESIVYFTRDLSPEGLKKAYERVSANITGKVAVNKMEPAEYFGNIYFEPKLARPFAVTETAERYDVIATATHDAREWVNGVYNAAQLFFRDDIPAEAQP